MNATPKVPATVRFINSALPLLNAEQYLPDRPPRLQQAVTLAHTLLGQGQRLLHGDLQLARGQQPQHLAAPPEDLLPRAQEVVQLGPREREGALGGEQQGRQGGEGEREGER